MRGRIEENISDTIKNMDQPALIQNYHNLFREMTLVNKAHTVMLYRCGILDQETSKNILRGIEIASKELKASDLDQDRGEDLYLNVEAFMIEKVGSDAGKMHLGRSRNDLYSTIFRMVCKREMLKVMTALAELQLQILDMAEAHKETVVTGYTHVQPAQPATLGHWLTACAEAFCRDGVRLRQAFDTADRCPLGAAAFAGTEFPVNRMQSSSLLGFSRMAENTQDAVASRDYFMQAEAAMAIMQNDLSRMAQDIYTWCTDEFGVWELGGEVSGQSSIMPQKKNPSSLEKIKAGCSVAFGALTESFLEAKNTSYSFISDTEKMNRDFQRAVDSSMTVITLMKEVLKYSSFNKEMALKRAETNFCTVTALADLLVSKYGISFRDAHHITGAMVADAKAAGLDVHGMNAESLNRHAEEICGKVFDITDQEIQNALLPAPNVMAKKCFGGTAPEAVQHTIIHMREEAESELEFCDYVSGMAESAERTLNKQIQEILK